MTAKEEIKQTSKEIRHISYMEKKSYNDQVNDLLDKISALKTSLRKKTDIISSINTKLERLTWFTDLDEECLEIIHSIITMGKDFYITLNRYYSRFNKIRSRGIAKNELKEFKAAIDDLKEIISDIESVFFELPYNKDFLEINKKLSTL